jgi:hypothetical protein
MEGTSFGSLFYRYWCYGWLFRNVNHGSPFERHAAWRHNQACARWLPTYMRRWAALGVGSAVIGALLESLAAPVLQIVFYVPSVVSVSVGAITLAAWVGLKVMESP